MKEATRSEDACGEAALLPPHLSKFSKGFVIGPEAD